MWHTPSNLSRYADRARVPIRECLADVLAENRSDLPDVDFDDYEAVYDALLQSEKIVRGRTSFAVEVDDATTLRYSTARPDAPEVASTSGGARGDRGKPFGNPLFRAEGDLFENVAPGGGGGGWPPRAVAVAARASPWSSSIEIGGASASRGGARTTLSRRSRPPPRDDAEEDLVRQMRAVLTEAKAALALERGGDRIGGGGAYPHSDDDDWSRGRPARLGPRFNAVSRDAKRKTKRREANGWKLARPAFVRWRELATSEHDAADAVAHARATTRRKVLEGWSGVAKAASMEMRKRALVVFTKTSMARAFRRWVERVDEVVEMRDVLERAVGWFTKRELTAAFNRWLEWREEIVEMREIADRAMKFLVHRAIVSAFNRWIEWHEETRELREIANRAMTFFVNRAVVAAFNAWADNARELRNARVAIKWWAERALVKSWLTWMDHHIEYTRAAYVLKARVWGEWCELADERRERLKIMRRVADRLNGGKIAAAFGTWRERVDDARAAKRALVQWQRSSMRAAFYRWKEDFMLEAIRRRGVLERAARNFMKAELAAAWRRWLEHVDERAAEKERQLALVSRVLARVRTGKMGAAFDTWQRYVLRVAAAERALTRWFERSARGALYTWRDHVAHRRAIARAIRHWREWTLATVYRAWLKFAIDAYAIRAENERVAAAAEEEAARVAEEAAAAELETRLERERLEREASREALLRRLEDEKIAAEYAREEARRAREEEIRKREDDARLRAIERAEAEARREEARKSREEARAADAAAKEKARLEREATRAAERAAREEAEDAARLARAREHRAWRRGVDACRAWRERAVFAARERVAVAAAASLDARRTRRKFIDAWLRVTLAAYVGREGVARRALERWRRSVDAILETTTLHAVAIKHHRRVALRERFDAWARAWTNAEIDRETCALAAAHLRERRLKRAFSSWTHRWARKVLQRAFIDHRYRKIAAKVWSSWQFIAIEAKVARVSELRAARAEAATAPRSVYDPSPRKKKKTLVGDGPFGYRSRKPLSDGGKPPVFPNINPVWKPPYVKKLPPNSP